ncbi:MAG TPA: LysM peptidoglycan-binding domain-containing protein [Candidatus Kapabacteria bacterium]|nr:LysM peptidoglycan-binding domain-containing protein [Candidatus Kapabacteria bacterium]
MKRTRQIWGCVAVSFIVAFSAMPIKAQQRTANPGKPLSPKKVFKDEYSEFDSDEAPEPTGQELVKLKLEHARQWYINGLSLIERKDTTHAAEYFEEAMLVLNELVSYPGIEKNEDFLDLAQSIIEDYEGFVDEIDNLPSASAAFVLREKLFQEVDAYARNNDNKINIIPTDTVGKTYVRSIPGTTVPITINDAVEKSVAFLTQNKGRKFYQRWLERSGRWFPMMKRIAQEEGVPQEIVYLSMMESGLNPNAVSRAKAVGLWQFMQSTGEMYNLRVTRWTDERRHPEKSTRAAMRHLRDLYGDFGDWHLALASYNYGPNGVRRAIKKTGMDKPTFWDVVPYLPKETRNYVPLFLALTIVTSNPAEYGFDIEQINFEPEHTFETMVVNEPVALSVLAQCAGVSLDELRSLNTELTGISTPPGKPYELRLKVGTLQTFRERYAALTDEDKRPWIDHVVQKKETLLSIGRRYSVAAQQIADLNGISDASSKLRRGAVLRIPLSPAQRETVLAQQEQQPALTQNSATGQLNSSQASTTDTIASQAVMPMISSNSVSQPKLSAENVVKQNSEQQSAKRFVKHTVKQGENLSSIARSYGVRLSDLRLWNNMAIGSEEIRIGERLNVAEEFGTMKSVAEVPSKQEKVLQSSEKVSHTVSKGETLAQIANEYNIALSDLLRANKMSLNSTLVIGKTLIIPNGVDSRSESRAKMSAFASADSKKLEHKVKTGENIGIIAATYGVEVNDIRRWNPTIEGNRIIAGEKLTIYAERSAKGSSFSDNNKTESLPKHYIVRKGDSLTEIAEKFGVNVQTLRKKNKLRSNNVLAGQRIRIQ